MRITTYCKNVNQKDDLHELKILAHHLHAIYWTKVISHKMELKRPMMKEEFSGSPNIFSFLIVPVIVLVIAFVVDSNIAYIADFIPDFLVSNEGIALFIGIVS